MKLFTPEEAAPRRLRSAPEAEGWEARRARPVPVPVAGPDAAAAWPGSSVREGVPGDHRPGLRAVAVRLRYVLAHDRRPAGAP